MVDFPPFMPNPVWWNQWLNVRINGYSTKDAIIKANETIITPRDFARFTIQPRDGCPLVLSIPVEGGGRQLRNINKISELKLSEHGDWRRNHLRSIEACMGKQPFYIYLAPEINKVYNDRSLLTLRDFNTAIFQVLHSFILGDTEISYLNRFSSDRKIRERGIEIAQGFSYNITSLEILTSFGKEAVLGFMGLNL